MSLKVWVKLLFSVTIIALIYIHMQTQIFHLAYQGKDKEARMHELRDRNGVLTHQILSLKSSNHLGAQLLERNGHLQFMDNNQVLTLTGPVAKKNQKALFEAKNKNENSMWNFLSFLTPQEAKAWDRE